MIRILILGLLALMATPAVADEAAWRALGAPGAVAIMRHALAPGTGDPAGFDLADCRTQRVLDAAGRAQARAIGALTGTFPASGEILVLAPGADGSLAVTGRIRTAP